MFIYKQFRCEKVKGGYDVFLGTSNVGWTKGSKKDAKGLCDSILKEINPCTTTSVITKVVSPK